MVGATTQPPTTSTSSRSSSVVNGNHTHEYPNDHGELPDPPGANGTPVPVMSKKGKGKKAIDPNENQKLVAARLKQLERDQAAVINQDAEIRGYCSLPQLQLAMSTVFDQLAQHDLSTDVIARALEELYKIWPDNKVDFSKPAECLSKALRWFEKLTEQDFPKDVITLIEEQWMKASQLQDPYDVIHKHLDPSRMRAVGHPDHIVDAVSVMNNLLCNDPSKNGQKEKQTWAQAQKVMKDYDYGSSHLRRLHEAGSRLRKVELHEFELINLHYKSLQSNALPTGKSMRILGKTKTLTAVPLGPFQLTDREVEKATRDLNSLIEGVESERPRVDLVQKKYTDLVSDMKKIERELNKSKKRADQLQKERDSGRSEFNKVTSMKDKLEKLCRELTRDNKKTKDEHKRLEDTEKRSRENIGARLDNMLQDVNSVLQQKENPESQRLSLETDDVFCHKFKSYLEQYELRELHFLSLTRNKDCEVQYNVARYEQQRKAAENEAQRARNLSNQVSTFSQTETELRSQLNIYVEKFKQVEDTLNNSNDLFLTFRKEMEEMSKKTKRLEKENLNLTRKHDLTNRNILEMAEERTKSNKELEHLRKKEKLLESTIRGMQDQGRGPTNAVAGGMLEGDEEGTESEYDEDDYDEDEEGSEEGEYDEETEEEVLQAQTGGPATFGPVPPPPATAPIHVNGQAHGKLNGEANSVAT